MATKNAIDSGKPIEVTSGGTGAATLTDHSPLIGSGTAAFSDVVVGTTGLLFIGSAAADPFFDDTATGDFTFTSSTASQTRILTVSNTDNTGAATSAARLDLTVGGANVGDPQVKYLVTGSTTWSTGIDNSDSDAFKISANAALGTSDVMVSTTAGEITKPLTSSFLAKKTANDANATGDGTIASYVCNSEIFDQNSDYNTTTGQFTAPVTGRYLITTYARLSNSAGSDELTVYINTSNRRYLASEINGVGLSDLRGNCTSLVDMDSSDIAYPQVMAAGGAKVAAIQGNASTLIESGFSGVLVC